MKPEGTCPCEYSCAKRAHTHDRLFELTCMTTLNIGKGSSSFPSGAFLQNFPSKCLTTTLCVSSRQRNNLLFAPSLFSWKTALIRFAGKKSLVYYCSRLTAALMVGVDHVWSYLIDQRLEQLLIRLQSSAHYHLSSHTAAPSPHSGKKNWEKRLKYAGKNSIFNHI